MIRIKRKVILFILSILILVLIFSFYQININTKIYLNEIIKENEFEKILTERKEYKETVKLYYNGYEIPYIKNENYYILSTDANELYLGNITTKEDFKIKIKKINNSKKEIIEKNLNIIILLYNKEFYKTINLKLTLMPIINISDLSEYSNLTLFNYQENAYNVMSYNCNYHIRGASSKDIKNDKKSYKIEIENKNGKNKKVSFLGMNFDDDWILNPMYFDYSFMREKIAYDLWNKISKYKTNTRYVELIINNEYKGVYLLQEPVNLDTFKANKTDLLVTIKNWNSDVKDKDIFKEITENDVVDEFEFENGITNNFNLRLEIVRKFYSEIFEKEYENDIKLEYDYNVLTDYFVFINLINSIDNTYKNEKILFEKKSENTYIIKKNVWDLDWSIYNEQVATKLRIKQILDVTRILNDKAIPDNIKTDDKYLKDAKIKYFNMKRDFYNTVYINNLINEYDNYLKSSGVLMRNNSKNYENSIKNIRKFFEERIPVLDNYFGGL